MMKNEGARPAIVVTTINEPTQAVREIAARCLAHGFDFHVIGDAKSPANFVQEGALYKDLSEQALMTFKLAQLAPTGHYARKNLGYLEAMRRNSSWIAETDDDNVPTPQFWEDRRLLINGNLDSGAGWSNVYRHFTTKKIWPRGYPLQDVARSIEEQIANPQLDVNCPIQQGLADGDPDVDAVYRLLFDLPVHFDPGKVIILDKGVWCPFNSQNTTWWPPAYPLMYLPFYCSWRVTDIWRSLIAQRIAWENDWRISFHSPSVYQHRNEHILMRDFEEEIVGYLGNHKIRVILEDLTLRSGEGAIAANMRICYDALIEAGFIESCEAEALNAWLSDVASLMGRDDA